MAFLFATSFIGIKLPVNVAANDIEPYTLIKEVNVNKTVSGRLYYNGAYGTVYFKITGSYMLNDNNGNYSVSDVNLSVSITEVTNEFFCEIVDVAFDPLSKSVVVLVDVKYAGGEWGNPGFNGYKYDQFEFEV